MPSPLPRRALTAHHCHWLVSPGCLALSCCESRPCHLAPSPPRALLAPRAVRDFSPHASYDPPSRWLVRLFPRGSGFQALPRRPGAACTNACDPNQGGAGGWPGRDEDCSFGREQALPPPPPPLLHLAAPVASGVASLALTSVTAMLLAASCCPFKVILRCDFRRSFKTFHTI